jgi:RHS repeat-associated protein
MKNFLISTLFHKAIATGKAGLCLLALGTGASMYGTTALYKLATAPPASAPAAASAKVALTQYSAGTREGLIGVTEAVPVDNPADNVFHVQVKEALSSADKVYLVYELSGVADHTAVSRGLNDQLSVGGYLVGKRKGWARQRELVNPAWLRKGDNVVRFTLPAGAGHSYRVRNLSLEVEKVPAGAGERELVVNQPGSHAYYQEQAYLKGFAGGEGGEKARITVDGQKVSAFGGEFEALVPRPKGAQQWTVTVAALYPDGHAARKEVSFSVPASADYRYGYHEAGQTARKPFSTTASHSISLPGAGLSAAKGDLSKGALLSITALREVDLPALDGGMVNVTRHGSGFRFLPHRTRFAKPVRLKLAYDEHKIPEGYTEKDIRTYFFDEESHHWVALPTDTVVAQTAEVFSRTTHFTDMINAIIKVPESPEVAAYNSTSIKGIKAANPTAGVNLINAPSANNTGNASLGYPLNLPAGRKGMQPQVAISYNSGGGNGWLGLGWNVQMPAVSIDTRWGVPRYDESKETETYSLNGEQLSPVAHRGEPKNRSNEKRFYPRVEGSFSRIIRHGDSPKNYWWEVTDKNGTRYSYGGSGTTLNESAVLRTNEAGNGPDKGNIAHWALLETRDLDGNFVRYHYTKQQDEGISGGSVKGYQLYVDKITYTGHGSREGLYSVVFTRDRQQAPPGQWKRRTDVTIAANLGFKQVTADLLKRVDVQFEGKNIRHYELHYQQGAFYKTLLDSLSEFDAAGKLFNTHKFDYYDDVKAAKGYAPFVQALPWTPGDDGVKGAFINPIKDFGDEASALSGTKSKDFSVGMAVTVGFNPNVASKNLSAGGNFGYAQSTSEGLLSMIDLNGDGLPDKVFVKDNAIRYRPNLSGPGGKPVFGELKPVRGITAFHKEKSKTVSGGVEAHGPGVAPVFVGAGLSTTTSTTTVYFSEVNGDQLTDVVVDGKVFFNHLDQEGNVVFTEYSTQTPSPISQTGSVAGDILQTDPAEREQALDQNPLHDVVRMWQAPYAGTVAVTAPVQLIESTDPLRQESQPDGVRVTIQHKGSELWRTTIGANDYTQHVPQGVSSIPVQKGDRIYFRVQSVEDGSFDQVQWSPRVQYVGQDENLLDANGKSHFRFAASEDFLLSAPQTVSAPIKGRVRIDGTFVKPLTSDDLEVTIVKVAESGTETVVRKVDYSWNQAVNEPAGLDLDVEAGDAFAFRVKSSSNVDWTAIRWQPRMYYTASADAAYPKVTDEQGKPLIEVYAAPHYAVFPHLVQESKPWTVTGDVQSVSVSPKLSFSSILKSGKVTFSVKKRSALVHKQSFSVTLGQVPALTPVSVPVTKGDELYFEYHIESYDLVKTLTTGEVQVTEDGKTLIVKAGVHSRLDDSNNEDIIFGPLYRGWGHFAYNGNRDRAALPINEAELKLSEGMTKANQIDAESITDGRDLETAGGYEPAKEVFIVLAAVAKEGRWTGADQLTYLNASTVSSSRLGDDDLSTPEAVPAGGSARAVNKITKSTNKSFSAGGSFGPIGGSYGKSIGDSKVVLDYMDMNGDRFPDIVTPERIQYTGPTGGLSAQYIDHGKGINHQTHSESDGVTLSGNFPLSESKGTASNPKKVTVSVGSGRSSAGLSGNFAKGTNYAQFSYSDINGDGLPDRVYQGGEVALNLGYSFAPIEQWGYAEIQSGDSKSYGAGLGVSIANGSISAGVGLSRSDNYNRKALQDVNGDGLVDQVLEGNPMQVRLNTGGGFAPAIPWAGALQVGESSSASESANVAFTAGIYIPAPVNIKICFNPSTSVGQGMSRELAKLSDVDGDGYPDYVTSSQDDKLTVSVSTIGRTNLLKSVQRPLGATFAVDYQRKGNTYAMPMDVWALSRVVVQDGFKGDGVDSLLTTFAYENGYYDRHEREFYGFGKVITNTHDTEKKDDNLYRSVVQTMSNDNYFTKGLLLTETLLDQEGRKYTEKENTYELKQIVAGEVAFPAVVQTEQRFFEGQSQAGKRTRMQFTYDELGNMRTLLDEGDLSGADDDIAARVEYHQVEDKYLMATPKSITVTANGKTVRKRESVLDQNTGNVTAIKQYLEDGAVALHELEYDPFGNLVKVIRPANAKGERLSVEYVYDDKVHSYVVKSSNSYGYASEASYDYRFGQLLSSKDLNGQPMQYRLDDLGRVVKITGPYELASGAEYTIKFAYHPEAQVPYALTHHHDPAHPGNALITSTFVDGLGRVLQTKKDVALYSGEGALDQQGMVVSGRVLFDGLGRTVKAYYPVSEPAGKERAFNPAFDAVAPSVSTFDVLDRTLRVTLPDGAATLTEYGFSTDRQGQQQFSTKSTDANGKQSEQFTDGRGRVTSVKQYTSEGDVWTSFVYNALGEQLQAIDDKGDKTLSTYDWLGRRISRVHPDAGLSTYAYDLAGNLTALQTANLQKSGEFVTYAYEYERLTDVTYPSNPENNVHYAYGEAGAGDNRAGRVVLQEDASGAQEFYYGPLGEVVKNTRTVVIPQHGAQTYTTQWQYDTWNRLTSMTYADGEKVSYTYNAGGLLHSMSGEKGGTVYHYVRQLGYDKFEQRVFLSYGNGTKTTYHYEEDRRRLKHMEASTSAKRSFMDNEYTYDKVNNILSLKNSAPVPSANLMGGSSEYSYAYDDLYRLTEAQGHYRGPNEQHRYRLQMRYNSVGSILEKSQLHQRSSSGSSWQEQQKTTYQQAYAYSQEQPHAAIHIGNQTYSYDDNGNQTGWTDDKSGQRRKIYWDEENRIRAIQDNGAYYHYVYDAQGERVLKGHSSGQNLYVNASQKAGSGNMSNYTVYVNPYIVLRSGGYTKHYYVGSQRIISKLGSGWDNSGKGPLETTKAGQGEVNYENKHQQLSDAIVKNLKFLGHDGAILTAGKSGKVPPGQLNTKGGSDGGSEPTTGTVESFQYYYHPDHLGSTSYITDASGEVYQHLEYFAFGETFVEEHSNTNRTPFLFNGKELDDETGLYYYGARYYDARTSIWQSVDPMAEKYPDLSPYNFVGANPVVRNDPDGADWFKDENGTVVWSKARGKVGDQVCLKGKEGTWTNIGTELLEFSGNKLKYSWQTNDKNGNLKVNSVEFNAVSGRPSEDAKGNHVFDYSAERQKDKGQGGLPEGLYSLEKSKLQLWADVPGWNQLYSSTGLGGRWKGGTYAWGRHRWWLSPEKVNTYGRSGFTIHGGSSWGSAGCIDLGTVGMTNFARTIMSRTGEKVYLKVSYTTPVLKLESLNTNTWQRAK